MSKLMNRFVVLLAQKEGREGRRYTQKEIAEAIGVSPSVISRWINGKDFEKSSLELAMRISKWFGCDIGDLVYIDRGEKELTPP